MKSRRVNSNFVFAMVWAAMTLLFPVPSARTQDPQPTGAVRFNRDIRPILADNCFQCHGPDSQARQADLRLDRFESSNGVGGGETVLAGGDADASELIRRITSHDQDERMPPLEAARRLTQPEITLLRRWAEQGARYEPHWAFVAPQRPKLPTVKKNVWPRNAIDYFVLARLEKEQLHPSNPADAAAIARRVSLDLIGLPPRASALERLEQDDATETYEPFVNLLLTSPRYGEHWATMWLDAARYADTNGYNNDTPRYNWKYRDWVIQALNRNLPYDQFVTEQLAGDLLPNATVDQQIATGFNRNHNVTSEGGIVDEEYRLEYVADRVHTTATVFMALTLRCARCHDHKFDPISQQEYYRVFAFFNQVPETGYHKEHVGNPKPVIQVPTAPQARQLATIVGELASCEAALGRLEKVLSEDERNTDANFVRLTKQKEELTKKQKTLTDTIPTAMVMRDLPQMRETYLLQRGAYDRPSDKVHADVPAMLPPIPADAARNRLGLARWLLDPTHPLTARVIINRLWAELFGQGLVTTQEDFGTQGATPSHPELLDWLAVELIESGWNIQYILRLIVTSATYRQSSRVHPELTQRDAQNELLARGPRFRLKAEVIRDSALAVSGLLVHKLGGPSVRPYQPAGLWVEVAVADDSYSGGPYVQSQGDDLYRRSVYTWWKRTCPPPNLNAFDAPEREFCRVQRSRTNTPLQALVLLNDPTFVEAARKLAERMINEGGADLRGRITYGFRLATSRKLSSKELDVLTESLARYRQKFETESHLGKELVSVGHSKRAAEMKTIELAAYTAIANHDLELG